MNSKILIFGFLFLFSVNATPSDNEPCDVIEDRQLQPDPENCGKFYQCSPNGWVCLDCPEGTLFNPDLQICDFAENVNCNDQPENVNKCNGSALNELKPNPRNNQTYQQCTSCGWIIVDCPEGLYFNQKSLQCEENKCQGAALDQLKPDNKYNDTYYQCTSCGWIILNCTEGFHFNPETLMCEKSDNDHCKSIIDIECDGGNVNDLKPDPKNCNRYYECTNYGWVGLPCPDGLYFNPNTTYCDYPENVDCDPSKC